MDSTLQIIINKINSLPKPVLIGISGFGGSGKSTFAKKLAEKIRVPVIGIDSFCKSNIHKDYELWNIMDFARLENEVLKPFKAGEQNLKYGDFDWITNKIEKEISINHNGILIVEGVGLFRPEIMQYFACTIWIDCTIQEAIIRGKKRDREEYNNQQDNHWDGIWQLNDLQCFKEFSPKSKADFIVDHSEIGKFLIKI
jgi:uridine kinase